MRLFGSSGIRGLANVEVTPQLTMKVGMAIASMFEGGAALVGRDPRTSGKMIELALTSGLVSCGFITGTLGVVPTPVVAMLTKEMQAEAGVSISASHNPAPYNGLKIFDSTGMAYTEEQQESLEASILEGEPSLANWNRVGRVEAMDLKGVYVDAVAGVTEVPLAKNLVCDLFNGATCTVASNVFEEIGSSAILINSRPDGRFPAGNPEPTPESIGRLGNMVRTTGAEIGFGFDGDGDRMMAVDERGEAPGPDRVLAAYARHLVEANGGGTVVTHVGASMSVDEAVQGVGGNVVRTKVGDVHITEAMLEHGAIFGGEPVGAWIHPDVHLCPDGILSAVKLMNALEIRGATLSEFVSDIPEYPTMRAKVSCPDEGKTGAMESILKVGAEFGEVTDIMTVDGVRLQLVDGWVLIRPSGTEPIIRITVEARDEKRAEELLETGRKFVEATLGD